MHAVICFCIFQACDTIISVGQHHWDDEQKMNYAYHGNQWVGYNDPRSMREKVIKHKLLRHYVTEWFIKT